MENYSARHCSSMVFSYSYVFNHTESCGKPEALGIYTVWLYLVFSVDKAGNKPPCFQKTCIQEKNIPLGH